MKTFSLSDYLPLVISLYVEKFLFFHDKMRFQFIENIFHSRTSKR